MWVIRGSLPRGDAGPFHEIDSDERRGAKIQSAVAPSDTAVASAAARDGVVPRRELFERLAGAACVTEVSAPAGSGKTFLLRAWIGAAGLADATAWVAIPRGGVDPQGFWLRVLDALRGTAIGAPLVRELTGAPDLDGWSILERLLDDLRSLEQPVWLVIDDLHELRSEDVLRQLELLLMRAPHELRFVLATRHDLRLGLHRLRLEGGLTEIRASDLRFTAEEARALFQTAGVELSDPAIELLEARTEGWAAGLRLAALSLAGHSDPERFAAEFSGSERTVAEYLLAEVLERQPEDVKRLLLRTSILDQVNGELADRLSGSSGGERLLHALEENNAFVSSIDPSRSWFRYHHMFADLLALELRRTAADEIPSLHRAAAEWFDQRGHHVEAVRHAQASEDWELAAQILSDCWFRLVLSGHAATAHELVAGFPTDVAAGNPELTALHAAVALSRGSFDEAERELAVARGGLASVPEDRRARFEVVLGIQRLDLARQRADLPAAAVEAERLLAPIEGDALEHLGISEERHAQALISLGTAEVWTGRLEDAERHLDDGIALARRIEQPYLELSGLAHSAMLANFRTFSLAAERSTEAIQLAQRHGWGEEPITGVAYTVLAGAMVAHAGLDEADGWFARAQATLRPDARPAVGLLLHYARGHLELVRGRHAEALADYRTAERLAQQLTSPHALVTRVRGQLLHALVRLGETKQIEQAITAMHAHERENGAVRTALAELRLAQHDPEAATTALAPVLDSATGAANPTWVVAQACLLEARARDALGDAGATERALEHALELAEPDGLLLPFLFQPTPELLERHARFRTTHASLISEILSLLAGQQPGAARGEPARLAEPLSESELRVLRYLPTNLSNQEIASELYVSVNTVKAHTRHLYAKLDAHRRGDAVERARALGLLAPSSRRS
ncbi:MAG TPA: LuxR C-terminal-related transcriptional regulator [Solirubrobacteraceae bacterium]|nr:LuxR C-terminal-related transcriptional regulator [Solirubrobacteraceae bacterium]